MAKYAPHNIIEECAIFFTQAEIIIFFLFLAVIRSVFLTRYTCNFIVLVISQIHLWWTWIA